MHILITGNPRDGFNHVGPFPSHDYAADFGGDETSADWWVVELTSPSGNPDPRAIEAAKRWVNDEVMGIFLAELANERDGGVSPATVSSTIDSISQGLPLGNNQDDAITALTSLLVIRDLVDGDTEIRELT